MDEPRHDISSTNMPLDELNDEPPGYAVGDGYILVNDLRPLSIEEKKRQWRRNAAITSLFIISWFLFAIILSVYNKWMFSSGFPFPFFVTSLHMFVQFALAALLRAIWPYHFRPPNSPSLVDYGKKVAPTALATCLDIGLSNVSLKTISLSFYTMCKSSSLIFVLMFAFLFRLETFSWRLVGVIFLITSGVLLMVATETHFVLSGFLLVLSASGLGGLRWGLTQILLKNSALGLDNPAATIYWLSPFMGISLAIISGVVEGWGNVFSSEYFDGFSKTLETGLFLAAPGIIAFCMVLSEFYILKRAGMVPMSIAGIAKEVTTITLSAWIFSDELTPLNITGVMITVCGISLYTFHKYRKSLETNVPTDSHGNRAVEGTGSIDGHLGYQFELDETVQLTATRPSGELNTNRGDHGRAEVLFSSEDEERRLDQ